MKWSDITVSKFRELQEIILGNDDELTKKIFIYSSLTGYRIEDARELPLGSFLEQYAKEVAFMNDPIPQVISKSWKHGEKEYNITTDISKLTAGQYIDFKNFAKEKDNIHTIMAVLCYDGKKYDGSNHEERAMIINEYMPITVAYPLCVFFLNLWNAWSEVSLAYFEKLMKEMKGEEVQQWSNTDGSTG